MRTTLLIAGDSLRALLHQRLLVVLVLGTLGLASAASVGMSYFTNKVVQASKSASEANEGELDEAQLEQMRQGLEMSGTMVLGGFCWFTALAGSLVTLFICCTAVAGDLRRGTIRTILSRPVSRGHFLLGRFCGAAVVMLAFSLLSAASFVIYSYGHGLDLKLALAYAPWLMLCQNLMMGAAALLLSLLVHPAIAGVVALFASASYFSAPNPLYYILPSYDRFSLFHLFLQRRMISLEEIFVLTLYALDVTAIFLLLAWWRFRSRDLL